MTDKITQTDLEKIGIAWTEFWSSKGLFSETSDLDKLKSAIVNNINRCGFRKLDERIRTAKISETEYIIAYKKIVYSIPVEKMVHLFSVDAYKEYKFYRIPELFETGVVFIIEPDGIELTFSTDERVIQTYLMQNENARENIEKLGIKIQNL